MVARRTNTVGVSLLNSFCPHSYLPKRSRTKERERSHKTTKTPQNQRFVGFSFSLFFANVPRGTPVVLGRLCHLFHVEHLATLRAVPDLLSAETNQQNVYIRWRDTRNARSLTDSRRAYAL